MKGVNMLDAPKKISSSAYLGYAKLFSDAEKSLVLSYSQWLPESIIDCHSHSNLEEHVYGINNREFNHIVSTFLGFSLEESKDLHEMFYPGKKVRSLRFSGTLRNTDFKASNSYLLEKSSSLDRIALYGLPDDIDYTLCMLKHVRVSALKMYHAYFEPPATNIYQYFPKSILESAQSLGIPIVLHPPTKITKCMDQVLDLVKNFPNLKICIAHMGLSKFMLPGIEEVFATLSKFPLLKLDTALVPSKEVIVAAIKIMGSERIMYGSDEPLDLIRSVPYINQQFKERVITEYFYHWSDPAEHKKYKHIAVGAVHSHWATLEAIRNALLMFPKRNQEAMKRNIFMDNAKQFYGF